MLPAHADDHGIFLDLDAMDFDLAGRSGEFGFLTVGERAIVDQREPRVRGAG